MKSKYCISSRVRIARNIKGFPFCGQLSEPEAAAIIDEVRGALGNEYTYINFSLISQNKRNVFVEKHLVSPEFASSAGKRALFLNSERNVSVMIGEEDHIRIQAFADGSDLGIALAEAQKAEDILAKRIEFMFDERYGYITKCPTNIGTGIRASVMMFLPVTVTRESIASLSSELARNGMTIRGLFGEGSSSMASLYQISNNVTLGVSEEEIISGVCRTVSKLEKAEEINERRMLDIDCDVYTDEYMRAIGILRSAYIMSSHEALSLISKVMLGNALDISNAYTDNSELYSLLLSILPSTLSENSGEELSNNRSRDKYRAKVLRDYFN